MTTFTNTTDGAASLLTSQLQYIDDDQALCESSRNTRRREATHVIEAARDHLTAGTDHPIHAWFGPDVLRSMGRPKAMDTLATVAGKAIEYVHPAPPDGDAVDDRPEHIIRTLTELALLKERRTKSRRSAKDATPPPPLSQFRGPALALASTLLGSGDPLLAVDVCMLLMVLLVTTRVNALRDITWGSNVKEIAGDVAAYNITLGANRGGRKNAKFFRVTTTDDALVQLEAAGLLSPSIAVKLLSKWHAQCIAADGELAADHLVFAPRMATNAIGTRFKATTGSTPGELRRRIAWDAAALVHDGELPDSVTAYLVMNMQHDAKTHVHDYETTASSSGSESGESATGGALCTMAASGTPEQQGQIPALASDPAVQSDTGSEDGEAADTAPPTTTITVDDFERMLQSRKDELTYTDTGKGWSIINRVRQLPIAEVMATLRDNGAGAPLTAETINTIDWTHCDRPDGTDFRGSATPHDNIAGQLVAVLTGAACPELHRDYPYLDMTCDPPVQRNSQYYVRACGREAGAEQSDDSGEGHTSAATDSHSGAPGPAMRGLLAALTAAHEQDHKRHCRR